MNNLRPAAGLFGFVVLAVMPAVCSADAVTIRRDNVIPVVFEDKLTVRDNRPGDTFTVRVTDYDLLPRGTEMLGRIDRIHPARGNRPASMDLRFTKILLPDKSRVYLDASPLPLDDHYITRTGDGRIIAKSNVRQQQSDILGGAIGGFIVGSILHRRVLGTIVGTMVGVVAADNDRAKDSSVVVNAGDKVGALINQDVRIDIDHGNSVGPAPIVQSDNHTPINLTFKKNDLVFSSEARPYWVEDVIMVPLESAAGQLQLDVNRRPDRTVYVDGPDSSMRLTLDSREARLDGTKFDLPRVPVEHNGIVYVPLDALLPLIKGDIFLNGDKIDVKSN